MRVSDADVIIRLKLDKHRKHKCLLCFLPNFTNALPIFLESQTCSYKTRIGRLTNGQIEKAYLNLILSRRPGYHLEVAEGIIPIYIDDDTFYLLAILLNDDFYKFMISGRKAVDGLGVLGAEHLIPFKWINLLNRKRARGHVNEKDLKKNKYDVFRLLQIITAGIAACMIYLQANYRILYHAKYHVK